MLGSGVGWIVCASHASRVDENRQEVVAMAPVTTPSEGLVSRTYGIYGTITRVSASVHQR